MHTTLEPFLEKEANQDIENIHLTLCSVKKNSHLHLFET